MRRYRELYIAPKYARGGLFVGFDSRFYSNVTISSYKRLRRFVENKTPYRIDIETNGPALTYIFGAKAGCSNE
jgi:hypothetical protein